MSSLRLLIVLSERGTLVTSQTVSGPSISFTMTLQAGNINDSAIVCGFLFDYKLSYMEASFESFLIYFYDSIHKGGLFLCVFD